LSNSHFATGLPFIPKLDSVSILDWVGVVFSIQFSICHRTLGWFDSDQAANLIIQQTEESLHRQVYSLRVKLYTFFQLWNILSAPDQILQYSDNTLFRKEAANSGHSRAAQPNCSGNVFVEKRNQYHTCCFGILHGTIYHSLNNCVRKVPAKKLKLGREQLQGTPFCILRLFCRLCPFPWQLG